MSVIYILICISIFVASIFLYLFIKSVRNGQFDDSYTPSVRMLFDDELKSKKIAKSTASPLATKLNKTENQI